MDFITGATEFPHKPGEFIRRQTAKMYHVLYFNTPFMYECDGILCRGNKDDMLIMEPGAVVYLGPTPEMTEGFVNDWAFIDVLEELLKQYPVPLNRAFSVSRHNYLRSCITELNKEKVNKYKGHHVKIDCLITQLIIDVHRAYTQANEEDTPYNRFLALRREIRTDPAYGWTLKEMAKRGGYSVSRFSNLYREFFGVSPIDDVIEMRIDKAKRMLKTSYSSIAGVAEECGFHSNYYFSKQFKKTQGLTPSQYAAK